MSEALIATVIYTLDDETTYLRGHADDLKQKGWSDLAVQPIRARADRIETLSRRLTSAITTIVEIKKSGEMQLHRPFSGSSDSTEF